MPRYGLLKGGRPRKLTVDRARRLAEQWLVIKRREPELTQDEYASHHGISSRSLRRYLDLYCGETVRKHRMEKLRKKREPDDHEEEFGGVQLVPWG